MGRCERLKWNRRKLGMTQADLAKKIGVSTATASRLESDETVWTNMRDTTDDAVWDTLRQLSSWQCDIQAIFKDNAAETDIRELRKKVREKRQSLGMSQKELGMMLGLDLSTVNRYEKHDKEWMKKRSNIPHKFMEFLNGKYDPVVMETQYEEEVEKEEKVTDVWQDVNGMGYTVETVEKRELDLPAPEESEGDKLLRSFNDVIDILQERMSEPNLGEIGRKTYVSMMEGICRGYLEHQ